MAHPHADAGLEHASAMADDRILDRQVRRDPVGALLPTAVVSTEVDAARAEILHQRVPHRHVAAAAAKVESVRACVGDAAILERDVLDVRAGDRAFLHVRSGLAIVDALWADEKGRVLKADSIEGDVPHDLSLRTVANELDNRRRDRHVGEVLRDRLAREGNVEELLRLDVMEPFARGVEGRAEVLKRIARTRGTPEEERTLHALLHHKSARLRVHGFHTAIPHIPALPDGHEHAIKLVLRKAEKRCDVGLICKKGARREIGVRILHVVVESVRGPGALGAVITNPELIERKPLRHVRHPHAVQTDGEWLQFMSTVKDGRARGEPANAKVGIRGREDERFRELVASGLHPNLHWTPLHGARGLQLAGLGQRHRGRPDLAVRSQHDVADLIATRENRRTGGQNH